MSKSEAKAKPHYHGHRQRLRERFLDSLGEGLPDYEILELILFQSIPRRDVKELSKELLSEFGSLSAVLSAAPDRLKSVSGVSDNTVTNFKVIYETAKRLSFEQVKEAPVLSASKAVIDYCHTAMAHESIEQFRVLYLDSKNRLIKDIVLNQGTVNHAPVYPREVVKTALSCDATAMILVHNHPSGDPSPSEDDLKMTEDIITAASGVGIAVHDHIIIGREGHYSFRSTGLL